jgi:hypothetical protein
LSRINPIPTLSILGGNHEHDAVAGPGLSLLLRIPVTVAEVVFDRLLP